MTYDVVMCASKCTSPDYISCVQYIYNMDNKCPGQNALMYTEGGKCNAHIECEFHAQNI